MDIKTAKTYLKQILKLNHKPVLLWSSPGIGKSSACKQIAEEFNWKFIDIRLPLLMPSDLMGLPMPDKQKNRAKWLYPDFFPEPNSKENILILFDEIGNASMSVQNSCYRIILDRALGEHYQFPKGVRMVAASNRETDKSGVGKFSAALANRFIHFKVEADLEAWKDWAWKNGINEKIIGFLKFNQKMFCVEPKIEDKAYPTPRCLDPNSMISMADKTRKKIKDIKIGDKILGFDEKTKKVIPSVVTNKFKTLISMPYVVRTQRRRIKCSGEHRFFTKRGYVQAKELHKDDRVYGCRQYVKQNAITTAHIKSSSGGTAGRWRRGFNMTPTELSYLAGLIDGEGSFFLCKKRRFGKIFYEPQLQICNTSLQFYNFCKKHRFSVTLEKRKTGWQDKYTAKFYGNGIGEFITQLEPYLLLKKPVALAMREYIRERNKLGYGYRFKKSSYLNYLINLIIRLNSKQRKKLYKLELETIKKYSNTGELFYDLETTTHNYIAEGFVVHNSWHFVSDLMNAKITDEDVIAGTIGKGACSEFFSYLEVYSKLPNIQDILVGKKVRTFKEPDINYAISSSLVSRANKKNIGNIFKYAERMPSADFHVLTIRDICRKDPDVFKAYPDFKKWLNKYSWTYDDTQEVLEKT